MREEAHNRPAFGMHIVTTPHHVLDNTRISGKLLKYSPPDENNPDHLIELTDVDCVMPDSSRPQILNIKYQCEPLAYVSLEPLGVDVYKNMEGKCLVLECSGSCSSVDNKTIVSATVIGHISAN